MNQGISIAVEDEFLTIGIFQGQPDCEEQLVRKFRSRLKSRFLSYRVAAEMAEDLAQETLLIVLQNLRKACIKEPHKLTAYVFATAKYVYIGWVRKKDNQLELRNDMDALVSQNPEMEQQLLLRERRRQLYESIDKLPVERDREILFRYYRLDQSKDEICCALTLSLQHYDRVISRARSRLRENMTSRACLH